MIRLSEPYPFVHIAGERSNRTPNLSGSLKGTLHSAWPAGEELSSPSDDLPSDLRHSADHMKDGESRDFESCLEFLLSKYPGSP